MASVTRLGLYGGPRQTYGTFTKNVDNTKSFTATFTRLALYAGARPLYGNFVIKGALPASVRSPATTMWIGSIGINVYGRYSREQ